MRTCIHGAVGPRTLTLLLSTTMTLLAIGCSPAAEPAAEDTAAAPASEAPAAEEDSPLRQSAEQIGGAGVTSPQRLSTGADEEPSELRQAARQMGASGLRPPVQVSTLLPEYTPEATAAGVEGDVYIEAVVTTDGTVAEPKLIRGLTDIELNRRAMEAITEWTFEPGTVDGEPVPVIALFTVAFRVH